MFSAGRETQCFDELVQFFLVDFSIVQIQGQCDVLFDIQNWDEIVKLVDEPYLATSEDGQFFVIEFGYIFSIYEHLATCRTIDSSD